MRKVTLIITTLFLLFSCSENNKNNVSEKMENKDYLEYSMTFDDIKERSKLGVYFFNTEKIYFGNGEKNIDIIVKEKTKKIIKEVLNRGEYENIHLGHKLDLDYINNFSNLLDKKIDKEIFIIIDPKYLNEIFIKNINKSNFNKIYLFLNPISCGKKYSISEKVIKELIKSKNITSFDNDRCRKYYRFENEKLFDKYITGNNN